MPHTRLDARRQAEDDVFLFTTLITTRQRIVHYSAYMMCCILWRIHGMVYVVHTWMRQGRQEIATYCILPRQHDALHAMAYVSMYDDVT